MGEHNVEQELDEGKLHEFMQALLADLRALAFMLENGCIESGVRRIGAEQTEKEHRWLPVLGPQLPLLVPVPVGKGEPGE